MNKFFDTTKPYSDLVGRVLIAALFVLSGWGKISAYAATQGYMQSAGVPGALLPLVILTELGGGLAIVFGLYTRVVALLLAGFAIITGFVFHGGSDQVSQIMLLKNIGLAGGFLFLVANGAGKLSLDGLFSKK
ncbi:DoxX family protein [Nevskia soli]|uniref:DoxX family protein n=1 Tax=Nevskia soli TaxID=418856 RepID=UPI0004A6C6F7|nr:DoxX family protein [Nevskia soli]